MADPFLELVNITKAYPGVVALQRRQPFDREGRGGRSDRRERRRQVDADEDPRRRRRTKRRRHPRGRQGTRRRLASTTRSPPGIAFVHQELNLFDNLDVAANVFIGREPLYGGPLKLIDTKALQRARAAAARPARSRFQARHAGRAAVARADAAPRDRQGAVARRPARHHGRADIEPHHHRDRTPDEGDRAS